MSDNYDIEKERVRIKKLIKDVLKEKEKKKEKVNIKNIKIINIIINKEE
jgi:hypothetical protein